MLKAFTQKKLSNTLPFVYDYLLSLPPDYNNNNSVRWPLILFLHGAGEIGSPIDKVKTHGIPKLVQSYSTGLFDDVNQECARFVTEKFITCSPQVRRSYGWNVQVLKSLLDELEQDYRVDINRIYVTGISMGGYGAWSLAMSSPHRFAAILPVCGGGDCSLVKCLSHLPIWVFHGKLDDVVPVEESEQLVKRLEREEQGKCQLTIYPTLKHDSWTDTYNNLEIYCWLLKQTKETQK
ncbi:unnamed protein product [Didymodactylos carnosus]|uniref:Phospholipase/carboxylesterase/thioesterase domain-containing protein n=1 Tax=Didymodactylos carnosus TaxID=1234261 RepID=A0A814TP15_9BILA|nr:unnamed protein product [Didymodactylos carnosus]CAF1164026.1 unnamed protein product [Didymodactylos carnosus]CAF3699712.1 unnamed protein product [Didymodactylos carnosus]CAF3927623.1 unnamed protein product [Didymodactylos carnosus]